MPLNSSVFGQVEMDLKNKKYSSAMMRLGSVSVKYSKDIIFLNYLAKTQKALSDVGGLIRTLKEINKIDSTPGCQLELMKVLYAEGAINEALDLGLALHEEDLSDRESKILSHMMLKIFIEENDFDGVHETIVKFGPTAENDDFMQWAMGLVSLSRNDKNSALTYFRKAVELNSHNDQAWVSLAMLHDEMGDRELALANIEMALDHNPLSHAAVKLYAAWAPKDKAKIPATLSRIQFYLAENEFDEEISLCHIQVLTQTQSWKNVDFEINKLILTQPYNPSYREMKRKLDYSLDIN